MPRNRNGVWTHSASCQTHNLFHCFFTQKSYLTIFIKKHREPPSMCVYTCHIIKYHRFSESIILVYNITNVYKCDNRNRRICVSETMVCVLITALLYSAVINWMRGGNPSLRFDFGALFFSSLFFWASKRKVTN
jgi:hypothetical protein